ncbi:MAG: class I SAM-dependent methyltransferase [Acidimicrobiales bacterium]
MNTLPGGQPDHAYFDTMAAVAQRHWWYQGRRALVADALAGRIRPGGCAFDVGCGTAETLEVLRRLGAEPAVGSDLSRYALEHARRGAADPPPVLVSLAERLPVADGRLAVLTSMDVIEHLDDDLAALREYRRALEPGGVLLVTVPAYQWLWGEHDERAGHRRRYTPRRLRAVVEAAGFAIERVTPFNSFLTPAAALMRRTPLRRLVRGAEDELSMASPLVNRIMSGLGTAERALVRRGVRPPVGLSILLVGRVPGAIG